MPIKSDRCAKLIYKAMHGINHPEKKAGKIPGTPLFVLVFVFALAGIYLYARDKVIEVYDGASFAVFTSQPGFIRVRLYGITCPGPGDPWGQEAKNFTSAALYLKKPALTSIYADEQGQQVAAQLSDGRLLNEELLRNGYAWVDRANCLEIWCASWLEIERRAKTLRRGYWNSAQAESTP
ncbi:MAG: thermonuclease family protein [Deltaproteobacteria bacterium]|jgi:endonuclease YncB( thermonuclease family)|nr:thermonuclease family protein [Deltaproteobacteria bacterium]